MQYRKTPKKNDKLSILGYGCMRFPQIKGKIDQEKATKQIHLAIEKGINYFDTAYLYHNGESELFLGKVLKNGLREKIKLATKLPQWLVNSRKDMDAFFNQQLTRLQTNYIDYYLVHAIDGPAWSRLKELGIIDFLNKLKQNKKALNLGFSYHGNQDDFKNIVDDFDWDFCQIQYNYLDENVQAGKAGLEYAAKKKLGIIIMEPLRGGNLSNNVPDEAAKIWDQAIIQRSPTEWALRWLWNHPEITVVLSGMTEDKHIKENIMIAGNAFANSLTNQELDLVNQVKKIYHKSIKVACTSCEYCMPCPAYVNIPHCFELFNAFHMFGNKKFIRHFYFSHLSGVMGNGEGYASLCINCGKCEKHCPQKLPIQQHLKEVTNDMEGLAFKIYLFAAKPVLKILRWHSLRKNRKM